MSRFFAVVKKGTPRLHHFPAGIRQDEKGRRMIFVNRAEAEREVVRLGAEYRIDAIADFYRDGENWLPDDLLTPADPSRAPAVVEGAPVPDLNLAFDNDIQAELKRLEMLLELFDRGKIDLAGLQAKAMPGVRRRWRDIDALDFAEGRTTLSNFKEKIARRRRFSDLAEEALTDFENASDADALEWLDRFHATRNLDGGAVMFRDVDVIRAMRAKGVTLYNPEIDGEDDAVRHLLVEGDWDRIGLLVEMGLSIDGYEESIEDEDSDAYARLCAAA